MRIFSNPLNIVHQTNVNCSRLVRGRLLREWLLRDPTCYSIKFGPLNQNISLKTRIDSHKYEIIRSSPVLLI